MGGSCEHELSYLEDHQDTSGKYRGKMKCDSNLSKTMAQPVPLSWGCTDSKFVVYGKVL